MVGEQVNFIASTLKGEFQGRGTVLSYIQPDREDGERYGAYSVLDEKTFKTYEVDERDVWVVRKAA